MIFKLSKFVQLDWVAMMAMFFLLIFGLMAVFSLSLESELVGFSNFQKQIIFLFISLGVFFLFSFLDYRMWKNYSGILYLIGVFSLIAVFFFGETIKGASGWFKIGSFTIQPVEFMKFFLIILLAKYFSHIETPKIVFKHVAVSFVYVLIPAVLVIKQPDMGAAVVLFVLWFGMLIWAGLERKYIILIVIAGLLVSSLGWSFILEDHQKQRFESFLDPQKDPLGSGYHVIQSMVAVGSGGLSGKGLGHGSQSQLNFLPEKHTDFIFSAIAEESGLIGIALLLGFLWLLLYRMKRISDLSRDNFGRFLVGGVIIVIFFQSFENIGMNIGIMPVAGLSLPFLSYGGSFLLVILALMGIVQSVWQGRIKRRITVTEDDIEGAMA